MKAIIVSLCCCLGLPFCARSVELVRDQTNLVSTVVVHRTYACFQHLRAESNYLRSDFISFNFYAKRPPALKVYIPKPEFYCRLRLLDEKGKEVGKRPAGERFGSRFDEVRAWNTDYIRPQRNISTLYSVSASICFDPVKEGTPDGRALDLDWKPVAIEELFFIPNIGRFVLTVEMQVFVYEPFSPKGVNPGFRLTRFPLVTIPVVVK